MPPACEMSRFRFLGDLAEIGHVGSVVEDWTGWLTFFGSLTNYGQWRCRSSRVSRYYRDLASHVTCSGRLAMSEVHSTSGSTRREFLRAGGLLAAGLGVAPLLSACATVRPGEGINLEEITVAELQGAMNAGRLDAETLVQMYLARIQAIDRSGPTLRSVQEINPDAIPIARALDEERRAKRVRG